MVKNQVIIQRGHGILANEKPTGSVLKETIEVSVTISIGVQN